MITYLVLRNFRNYTEEQIHFTDGLNLIHGPNGAGKTTVLEAIYFLSTGRSFRTLHLKDLIQKGKSYFFVEAHFTKDGVDQTLSVGFDGVQRKIHHNQTAFSSLSDLLGILPSVLFAPKDHALITGSPSDRRRFLNIQLAQTDPLYVYHLMRYHKAMKHRNALLKKRTETTMKSFEEVMAISARFLMIKRRELLSTLQKKLEYYCQILSQENDQFKLSYAPSIAIHKENEIEALYKKSRSKELILGTTLFGPHRDDFSIAFHGKEAKTYASEGQKRTAIAALKMAEWDVLAEKSEATPILCIDDFGIHLDRNRVSALHDQLKNFGQIILTTPLDLGLESAIISISEGQVQNSSKALR